MNMRTILVSIVLIILTLTYTYSNYTQNRDSDWESPNHKYRVSTTINQPIIPEYSFSVLLNSGNGTNNETTIYCNDLCFDNFSDVIFILDDHGTIQPEIWDSGYLKDANGRMSDKIWITIPNGVHKISVYYDSTSINNTTQRPAINESSQDMFI